MLKVNSQKCTHAYRCKRKVKATIIHYCVFFLFICSLRRVSLTCPKSPSIGGLHSSIAPSLSRSLSICTCKKAAAARTTTKTPSESFKAEVLDADVGGSRASAAQRQRTTRTGLLAFFFTLAFDFCLPLIGMAIRTGWTVNIVSYVCLMYPNRLPRTESNRIELDSFVAGNSYKAINFAYRICSIA